MKTNFFNRKAQGLPLNTIVIAILVIIVMLVIIVFFTSKVGESGGTIDETTSNLAKCDVGASILISDSKYSSATFKDSCNSFEDRIAGISNDEDQVCCALKRTNVNPNEVTP